MYAVSTDTLQHHRNFRSKLAQYGIFIPYFFQIVAAEVTHYQFSARETDATERYPTIR